MRKNKDYRPPRKCKNRESHPPTLKYRLLRVAALRFLGTIALAISVIVVAAALLGASLVKITLYTTTGRGNRVLHGCDILVAPQAHCKYIDGLDTTMGTTKMNPLTIPSCRDDVLEIDGILAHGANTRFLAENSGLAAAELRISVGLVGALKILRSWRWNTG